MTFFCIPFIVLYLLSHVKIVVCICMYSILNKILFTLSKQTLSFSCVLASDRFDCSDFHRLLVKNFGMLYAVMDSCT